MTTSISLVSVTGDSVPITDDIIRKSKMITAAFSSEWIERQTRRLDMPYDTDTLNNIVTLLSINDKSEFMDIIDQMNIDGLINLLDAFDYLIADDYIDYIIDGLVTRITDPHYQFMTIMDRIKSHYYDRVLMRLPIGFIMYPGFVDRYANGRINIEWWRDKIMRDFSPKALTESGVDIMHELEPTTLSKAGYADLVQQIRGRFRNDIYVKLLIDRHDHVALLEFVPRYIKEQVEGEWFGIVQQINEQIIDKYPRYLDYYIDKIVKIKGFVFVDFLTSLARSKDVDHFMKLWTLVRDKIGYDYYISEFVEYMDEADMDPLFLSHMLQDKISIDYIIKGLAMRGDYDLTMSISRKYGIDIAHFKNVRGAVIPDNVDYIDRMSKTVNVDVDVKDTLNYAMYIGAYNVYLWAISKVPLTDVDIKQIGLYRTNIRDSHMKIIDDLITRGYHDYIAIMVILLNSFNRLYEFISTHPIPYIDVLTFTQDRIIIIHEKWADYLVTTYEVDPIFLYRYISLMRDYLVELDRAAGDVDDDEAAVDVDDEEAAVDVDDEEEEGGDPRRDIVNLDVIKEMINDLGHIRERALNAIMTKSDPIEEDLRDAAKWTRFTQFMVRHPNFRSKYDDINDIIDDYLNNYLTGEEVIDGLAYIYRDV